MTDTLVGSIAAAIGFVRGRAVEAYNKANGALETRVLSSAANSEIRQLARRIEPKSGLRWFSVEAPTSLPGWDSSPRHLFLLGSPAWLSMSHVPHGDAPRRTDALDIAVTESVPQGESLHDL